MTERPILREITLGQILDEAIALNPDGDAVVYADRDYRLTYTQFGERVDRMAKGLMALGIQKGEKVAIWATNVPDWVTLQFATARIGAILLTVNPNYRSHELEYILRQSDSENIFIMDGWRDIDYVNTLYEVIPELRDQERGNLRSEKLPCLKRVFFFGHEKHRGMYSIPEVLSLAAMTSAEEYRQRQAALSPHDVVNMQYTSGTTGFPKGVMLTHYNVGNNGFWIGEHQKLTPKDRDCIPVPLFHCFGCVLSTLACVTHASAMVILESYDPLQVMYAVEKERCTGLNGVPTMFIAVLDHPMFDKFDFSSLRTGIMAGSPCPVPTMRQVIDKMNMKEITICYGLTEASPVTTQTRIGDDIKKQTETVGRPMPGMEVKTINPETGADCAVGEHGEIVSRGYNSMKGYYKMPEATAKCIDADGWLHSGDIGVFDADGYVTVTGRLKDMIIRGGENVYPKEVEDFLLLMPGILDVQVVGVASRKYGEEVGAFVRRKGDATITEDDVKDFCRGKIARYKTPKYVHFIDAFPMTASGKIQKYLLRKMAAEELWPDAP
jgi:fatty-acyl-CoA synthase